MPYSELRSEPGIGRYVVVQSIEAFFDLNEDF